MAGDALTCYNDVMNRYRYPGKSVKCVLMMPHGCYISTCPEFRNTSLWFFYDG